MPTYPRGRNIIWKPRKKKTQLTVRWPQVKSETLLESYNESFLCWGVFEKHCMLFHSAFHALSYIISLMQTSEQNYHYYTWNTQTVRSSTHCSTVRYEASQDKHILLLNNQPSHYLALSSSHNFIHHKSDWPLWWKDNLFWKQVCSSNYLK